MIEKLLQREEGKSLEFKENLNSPMKILKTAVAFANTAGGVIVIGVEDKTKKIVGVDNVLLEEEQISNLLSDSISPMLIPDIDIVNHSEKELILINIPHISGPVYLKKSGVERGAYIRIGSSNRLVDLETLANLQRVAKRVSFDELPCISSSVNDLEKKLISEKLKESFGNVSEKNYESLGLSRVYNKKKCATYGGLLLFSDDKTKWLPDALIKCVCFSSTTKKNIVDKKEIKTNLIDSIDEAIFFIQRNTRTSSQFGTIKRVDTPEYPVEAIREAVINSIVHADYSMQGASIQISIYSDRIEIINPGCLTFGQTMRSALSGHSKMRNPIIGRIFREIGVIETLGMGMLSIIQAYIDSRAKSPEFEEVELFFKVTLYPRIITHFESKPWMNELQEFLLVNKEASTSEIAKLWRVSDRTARSRLNKMLEMDYIKRNAKSTNDPTTTYSKR